VNVANRYHVCTAVLRHLICVSRPGQYCLHDLDRLAKKRHSRAWMGWLAPFDWWVSYRPQAQILCPGRGTRILAPIQ
jgi:hypothetical protein